jgi:uroporphyrinogen-III synthase
MKRLIAVELRNWRERKERKVLLVRGETEAKQLEKEIDKDGVNVTVLPVGIL